MGALIVVLLLAIVAFKLYHLALFRRIPAAAGAPLFVEFGCPVWSDVWLLHHVDTVIVTRSGVFLNDVLGFMAYYRGEDARLHELDLRRIRRYGPASWKGPSPRSTNFDLEYLPDGKDPVCFHLRVRDGRGLKAALDAAMGAAPRECR